MTGKPLGSGRHGPSRRPAECSPWPPDGTALETLTASHITSVAALKGHALMIHADGDNYSDTPKPLGGGGGRIACGLIQ